MTIYTKRYIILYKDETKLIGEKVKRKIIKGGDSWIDYIIKAEQMIKRGEVKENTNLEALAKELKKKDQETLSTQDPDPV